MDVEFEATKEFADDLDRMDELSSYRDEFYIPKLDGKESIYFNGNSLGLQPKRTKDYINQELEDWKEHAGEGHFKGQTPWMPYHEFVTG
ncbi:MAG: kynureninase, partial [Candidatus Heimdallarchaeota archaeon]|nr:kynureninase [Candidatus Heimdallarchaeota archaeon]